MRRIDWLKGFALLAALAVSAAPLAAEAECKAGKIADLPVTMSGPQPLVSGKVNGVDVEFVADTGAFYSMLTPANAAELHLSLHSPGVTIFVNGVGGSADVSAATVKTLSLAGHDIRQVEFLIGGGEVGSSAIGVLGQNILGLRDAEF